MKILMMIVAVSVLAGCTSDTRSMWHSRSAFKTVGQVSAMCDDGDRDACYAARDMGAMQVGLNQANQTIQQQQAQQAAIDAANRPITTNCNPTINGGMSCTTY